MDERYEREQRRIKPNGISAELRAESATNAHAYSLTLVLRLEDSMVRQVSTDIHLDVDTPPKLAHELVMFGCINEADAADVERVIEHALQLRQQQP